MLFARPSAEDLWKRLSCKQDSSTTGTVLEELLLEDDLRDEQANEDCNDVEPFWKGSLHASIHDTLADLEKALFFSSATQRAWNTTLMSPEYRVLRHTLLTSGLIKTVALGNDIVFKCSQDGDLSLVRITTSGAHKASAKRRLNA
jgi:hypothetical protein